MNIRLKNKYIIIFVLISFISPYVNVVFGQNKYNKADAILGLYHVKDPHSRDESIVEIYKDKDEYRGKCVVMKYEYDDNGNLRLDENNPDPAKRNNTCCNTTILYGFTYDKKKDKWIDGHVYDPNTGKIYKSNISIENEDEILLRGYIGLPMFGKSMKWQRVNENNLPF